jgi:hypothetical protein
LRGLPTLPAAHTAALNQQNRPPPDSCPATEAPDQLLWDNIGIQVGWCHV